MIQNRGSLTRANKLILGDKPIEGTSVFTLHNWNHSSSGQQGSRQDGGGGGTGSRRGRSDRYKFGSNLHTRLLLFKAQESALNFLFRWLLLDDWGNRRADVILNRGPLDAAASATTSGRNENNKKLRHQRQRKRKPNRLGLLLGSVPHQLPDRRLLTIVKYIFWRWLTWTNGIELLLNLLLVSCCSIQCYGLLGEYFEYPTHVSVTKAMNDDFVKDLPAITLCSNNIISRQSLRENFPNLNESHFLAITYGTFYSVDNFTLNFGNGTNRLNDGDEEEAEELEREGPSDEEIHHMHLHMEFSGGSNTGGSAKGSRASGSPIHHHVDHHRQRQQHNQTGAPINPAIDWLKVLRFLTKRYLDRAYETLPGYDLVDRLTCANLWGDEMPCESFPRIRSLQQAHMCDTLFHDSVFWDQEDPVVQELASAIIGHPSTLTVGDKYGEFQMVDLYDKDMFDSTMNGTSNSGASSINKTGPRSRIEMGNMEMIRLRIDFRSGDYANNRTVVGGLLAIHSSSVIGSMDHIVYNVEPGHWYNFYIERFDYKRLPPPYDTKCYNYEENRYSEKERNKWTREDRLQMMSIIMKQANRPGEPLEDYVNYLRKRSLSGRECMHICSAELPASKCNCWPRGIPYLRNNNLDISGTMHYCDHGTLMKLPNASKVDGDDLYYQLCAKDFTLTCVAACPDECNFSSFDVTEQARNWPSHESRRYITDQGLLASLKEEAECCATVSVIYAGPTSSYHVTEPKYTRQDIVTIVSGNIEAWVGLSAVHAYLFLEQFYDALVEAQLISPPPTVSIGKVFLGHTRRLLGPPISILTKLKVEICQLFTYLFHQLAKLSLRLTRVNNSGQL